MNVPSLDAASPAWSVSTSGVAPGFSPAGARVASGGTCPDEIGRPTCAALKGGATTASAALRGGATTARAAANGGAAETPAHKKLRKAAQEFEGILISQLLQDLPMGFASLSGDTPLAGSETLNSLAVQTLSTAMAGRGGFGIAQMLVHQLEPSLNRGGR